MEGALKLKEISYIHAEAYAAGELKHGPLALVDADMPVVAVAPNDQLLEKLKSNLEEVGPAAADSMSWQTTTPACNPQRGSLSLPWGTMPGYSPQSFTWCRSNSWPITWPWRGVMMSISLATWPRASRWSESRWSQFTHAPPRPISGDPLLVRGQCRCIGGLQEGEQVRQTCDGHNRKPMSLRDLLGC